MVLTRAVGTQRRGIQSQPGSTKEGLGRGFTDNIWSDEGLIQRSPGTRREEQQISLSRGQ